jgi:hypothetical protein
VCTYHVDAASKLERRPNDASTEPYWKRLPLDLQAAVLETHYLTAKQCLEETAAERDMWKKGCDEWTKAAHEARERVRELEAAADVDKAPSDPLFPLAIRLGLHPAPGQVVTEDELYKHVLWLEERARAEARTDYPLVKILGVLDCVCEDALDGESNKCIHCGSHHTDFTRENDGEPSCPVSIAKRFLKELNESRSANPTSKETS